MRMNNKLTGIIFNKFSDLLGVMDAAIINYDNAAWARIGIGEWELARPVSHIKEHNCWHIPPVLSGKLGNDQQLRNLQ